MLRTLSPWFVLLCGFALAPACGGSAVTSGGDGDGDGDGGDGDRPDTATGDGDLPGDGDGAGATSGDGDVPGDGDSSSGECEPGAVRLCDVTVADQDCTGIQLCDQESEWESCRCPRGGIGGDGTGGDGSGAQSAGGAGGAGPIDEPSEPICPDEIACGGDAAGDWVVRSSCLTVAGEFDISALGLGCIAADIFGDIEVIGRLHLSDNWQVIDETTTLGDAALAIAQECLDVSGTVVTCEQIGAPLESSGFSSVSCLDSPSGGCLCAGQIHQSAGMGRIDPNASTHGAYTLDGEILTLETFDPLPYSYCAVEDSLVVSPTGASAFGTTHGTIVLERAP